MSFQAGPIWSFSKSNRPSQKDIRALRRAQPIMLIGGSGLRSAGSESTWPQAYDFHLAALESLQHDKLNVAMPDLRRMLRHAATAGHLNQELLAHELLGDVYRQTKVEPEAALYHYIRAEKSKAAKDLASSLSAYIDLRENARMARHASRAAAFAAAAVEADLIPDDLVDEWVGLALAEVTNRQSSVFGPHPWVEAFNLLAGLAPRLDLAAVNRVWTLAEPLLIRGENQYTWVDDAIVDFFGTASPDTVGLAYLAEKLLAIVSASSVMGSRLCRHSVVVTACMPRMTRRLLDVARNGNTGAIEMVALYGEDPDLARESVEREIGRPNAYSHEGHVHTQSVIGGVVESAYAARVVPNELRVELATTLLRRALDTHDARMNRTQAVQGIHVLAEHLPVDIRSFMFEGLLPLALGNEGESAALPAFEEQSHPLSTFQINYDHGSLRRAAVEAIGDLATTDEQVDSAAQAVQLLLGTAGSESDFRAVAQACFDLSRARRAMPVDWVFLATSQQVVLRQAAAALVEHHLDRGDILQRLLSDPSPRVRREFATACRHVHVHDPDQARRFLDRLGRDDSFRVRKAARESVVSIASSS